MAHFYFHMRDGERFINDEEGQELLSLDHALEQALLSTRELVADAIKSGRDPGFDALVVADERGRELTSVRAGEVLPHRLR
jgi:hypothetical protein